MKPIVEPLARWQRRLIFFLLLVAFLLSLPAFIFYATGYRYNFFSDQPSITATGGLYIAAEAIDSKIFIDELEVTNARVFRKAYYIQGLQPSLHRVHVQTPGRNTWVKNLVIQRHIVTEAEAFNLPLVPQIRPVTEYQKITGEAVFVVASTTNASILDFASSSVPFFLTTTKATSTYRENPEYDLITDLFLAKASTTAKLKKEREMFSFSTTSSTSSEELATTTITRDNLTLYQNGDEVFVGAIGIGKQIPHYFCTSQLATASNQTAAVMTGTLAGAVEEELLFQDTISEVSDSEQECRTEIRIDRKWQTVRGFDFFPDNQDLVLMTLEDGLYVVEIDDRAWQNVQLLYPGRDLQTIVYSGSIFVKDGNFLLEVLPEIITE